MFNDHTLTHRRKASDILLGINNSHNQRNALGIRELFHPETNVSLFQFCKTNRNVLMAINDDGTITAYNEVATEPTKPIDIKAELDLPGFNIKESKIWDTDNPITIDSRSTFMRIFGDNLYFNFVR